uniref:Carboxypeptidase regulatory-like domain-containing protein n=1 Tax=viral metagenome TaxID=1070528 RepID=A0A6M3MA50_9ZZZZ
MAYIWKPDSSIVSGLGDIGTYSALEVFLDGTTLKIIAKARYDGWFGFYWDGSTWISNQSIVNGLADVSNYSNASPTIFKDGATWKLIHGVDTGTIGGYCKGYYWNGSKWILSSAIVSGIGNIGWYPSPGVFLDGSTRKLLVFCGYLNYYGLYWNGSTWVRNDAVIIAGLGPGVYPKSPTVFLDGSTIKLIFGNGSGGYHGYYWSGSAWISDPSIIAGLYSVPSPSTPSVFLDGSTRKLITGDRNGNFHGFEWAIVYTISGTVYDENNDPLQGVSIEAVGTTTYNTTTAIDGTYSLTVNPDQYTVTASKTLYDDNVASVDARTSNQTQNFTMVLTTYTISGTISDELGNKLRDVDITISNGTTYTTTTDENGAYTQVVNTGTYDIAVSKSRSTFHDITESSISVTADTTQNITMLTDRIVGIQKSKGMSIPGGIRL